MAKAKSIVEGFKDFLEDKNEPAREPTLKEWLEAYQEDPIPIKEEEDFDFLERSIASAQQAGMRGDRSSPWFEAETVTWAGVLHLAQSGPLRGIWGTLAGLGAFGAAFLGPLGILGNWASVQFGKNYLDESLGGADGGILSYFVSKKSQILNGTFNWDSKQGKVFLYLIHPFMAYYTQNGNDPALGIIAEKGADVEDDIENGIAFCKYLFRQASIKAPGIWPQPNLGNIDPAIREDFNYRKFGLDATQLINNYMDGLDLGDGVDGWAIIGLNYSKDDNGKSRLFSGKDDKVEGDSMEIATKFIDDSDGLSQTFKKGEVSSYTDPFPGIQEETHTIRLEGPLYAVEVIGMEDRPNISYHLQKFLGFNPKEPTSKPARAYDELFSITLHKQIDEVRRDGRGAELNIYGSGATWTETFNNAIEKVAGKNGSNEDQYDNLPYRTGYDLAQMILNNLRLDAWNKIADTLKDVTPDEAGDDVDKLVAKDVNAAQDEFNQKHADKITGKEEKALEEKRQLSEEQIKDRQRFIKQCALMTRLPWFKIQNRDLIKRRRGIHKDSPYDGRFYLLDSGGDKLRIPSKLIIPKEDIIRPFLEMTPDIHAFLVPKLRLFKVYGRGKDLKEIEFFFENFVKPEDVGVNTIGETYDRGHGAGIKSFSFTCMGTTPATARNDIQADLVLFFQSFNDFVIKRKFKPNQGKHAYVDLLLLPVQDQPQPYLTVSPIEDSIDDYRIRADIGWIINKEGYAAFENTIKNRFGSRYTMSHFNQALSKMNKSFYLNMVDHNLDIKEDGTVEIKANYRAYAESLLKGSEMDALSTKEVRDERQKFRDEYQEKISNANCNERQLAPIRRQMLQKEKALIKNSYRSIVQRMTQAGLIYYIRANPEDMAKYASSGVFLNPVRFEKQTKSQNKSKEKTGRAQPKEASLNTSKAGTDYELDTEYQFIDTSVDGHWTTINFFFLGDLLYTILDCVVENKEKLANFKFLLSSFNYDDLFGDDGSVKGANLADIPVSVDYFFEWYTNNVIKTERVSYPVMYFIRDLCRELVTNVMSDNCFKVDINKGLNFQTGHYLSIGDPFATSKKNSSGAYFVDRMHAGGELPFANSKASGYPNMNDFYNFLLLYPIQPSRAHSGIGNKIEDGELGTFHYQLGAINGIVKNIKFAKTDIKYLREARFFRNGNDGLMQLGNTYKVTLDMIGNTLYYPGMEFYVDPAGIGKGTAWNPTIPGSVANALGIGGYHLVTKVSSQIAPGKFTTSVEGVFIFSGDGRKRRMVDGISKNQKIEKIDEKPRSEECEVYVEDAYKESLGGGQK